MSPYQLQARRTETTGRSGSRREETRLVDADGLDGALRTGRDLVADGFTVWIFRRHARPPLTAAPTRLRLVTTLSPTEPDPPPVPSEREQPAGGTAHLGPGRAAAGRVR
ncbi:MAG TPA: hypothetical protein VEZ42_08905 [Pseudonocardia sp.]|nr:hypothetical protein [Pseudonocardia sp.]